jgi:hypothetical protein
MNTEDQALENILIHQAGDQVVVQTRREHKIDGMVTGAIFNLLGLPLLLSGIVLGCWMIVLTIIGDAPWFMILIGLLFVTFSAAPLYMLLWSQPAFFPYECRFKRDSESKWLVQRRLGLLTSRWRVLGDFSIVARPTHSKGDWGYDLIVKTDRSKIMLTPPGVFTPSKAKAHKVADLDCKTVAACLGVESYLEQWE